MSKLLKRIDFLLVFIFTMITASGCFDSPLVAQKHGPVELVSAPSTTTVKMMNENLYIGYLGAQRDFALIVDNFTYNLNNRVQNCGIPTSNGTIGCASIMANLLMNYGIKTSNYTGVSGSENLLMYYVDAGDFMGFGGPDTNDEDDVDGTWYDHLTSKNFNNPEYSDFEDSDLIKSLSCGTSYYPHNDVCDYAKELKRNGYSKNVGNSMILLFENGNLYDIITDKQLDPYSKLNSGNSNPNLDNLIITNSAEQQNMFAEYYNNIINAFKGKITVSNATNTAATSSGKDQDIRVINTLTELENLISGRKGEKDFLLFISSKGFIKDKIGTNKYYDVENDRMTTSNMTDGLSEAEKTAMLLINSVSTFVDNCAIESDPLLNFLKGLLQAMLSGTLGALGGAAIGAGAGALIGSIIPGIGTAIGAGVGAIVGAIAGFFTGLKINKEIEKKLKSANGISDKSYCKIVESALTDISINVPIYTYNIDSATTNIYKYEHGLMSDTVLKNYYANNREKCIGQYRSVAVPSGLISFLTDDLNDEYNYADECQADLLADIVGGFGGAPSLQLHLGNQKVDDLYGRVTTDLVNEMLSVWGLKSVGDVYTLGSTSTEERMEVIFASAQRIYNPVYCVSESSVPSCDGLQTYPVNIPSDSYLYTFDPAQGVKMDFTSRYISYSRSKMNEIFSPHNMSKVKLKMENHSGKLTYYKKDFSVGSSWHAVEELTGLQTSAATEEILTKIKAKLVENKNGNMYQIKFGDYNYVLCDSGEVIGYEALEDSLNIVYYHDGTTEYIFTTDKEFSTGSGPASYYTDENRSKRESIDSAHEFYVYMRYDIKSGDSTKTAYYSYAI